MPTWRRWAWLPAALQVAISHLRVLRDIYYGALCGDGNPREIYDVRYDPGNALPNHAMTTPSAGRMSIFR